MAPALCQSRIRTLELAASQAAVPCCMSAFLINMRLFPDTQSTVVYYSYYVSMSSSHPTLMGGVLGRARWGRLVLGTKG